MQPNSAYGNVTYLTGPSRFWAKLLSLVAGTAQNILIIVLSQKFLEMNRSEDIFIAYYLLIFAFFGFLILSIFENRLFGRLYPKLPFLGDFIVSCAIIGTTTLIPGIFSSNFFDLIPTALHNGVVYGIFYTAFSWLFLVRAKRYRKSPIYSRMTTLLGFCFCFAILIIWSIFAGLHYKSSYIGNNFDPIPSADLQALEKHYENEISYISKIGEDLSHDAGRSSIFWSDTRIHLDEVWLRERRSEVGELRFHDFEIIISSKSKRNPETGIKVARSIELRRGRPGGYTATAYDNHAKSCSESTSICYTWFTATYFDAQGGRLPELVFNGYRAVLAFYGVDYNIVVSAELPELGDGSVAESTGTDG